MSLVKISELTDAPVEGTGRRIVLEHPFTCIKYELALFKVNEKYYLIMDTCRMCGGRLSSGKLNGLTVNCSNEEHLWNVKTGTGKFNRAQSIPTYSVAVEADGLYINI